MAGLLALIAIPLNGPWSPDFKRLLLAALPAGSIAAAVIAAVASFANQTLPIDRKRSEPSSEEEFERLFRDLVAEVNDERIVIFIDELDRCSSDEVVKTLETIRTFLDVKPCVVIVAADQQVLERALRRRARQETPFDPRNPYYSSGSSYLDKIFNFQMSLPPLRSRRLSEFALALVRDRGGLWREIDIDWVLLALIPTHVRSPRRVKALLNGFVANYRLAQRRAGSGSLPDNVASRAAEIAKLTCLQVEFPLFAADLTADPRLPEFVLTLYLDQDAELPDHVPDTVEALALSYANLERDVDEVLPRDLEEDGSGASMEEPDDDEEDQGGVTLEDEGDEEVGEDEEEGKELKVLATGASRRNRASVRAAQGQHLLDYLQRAEQVGEIGSDLVYLEGRGTTFGIDPTRAEALENAAVNGDRRAVSEAFEQSSDEGETEGMLLLLAQVAREAPLGPESGNAIHVMLSAVASNRAVAARSANELLRAFWAHQRHFSLGPDDLQGALVLALEGQHDAATNLLEQILHRREAEEDQELALALIAAGRQVLDLDPERVGMVSATWLDKSAISTTRTLLGLSDDDRREVLDNNMKFMKERVKRRVDQIAAERDEQGNLPEDAEAPKALAERNERFEEALALALEAGNTDIAETLVIGLLAAGTSQARELVEKHLEGISPVSGRRLRDALLSATTLRPISRWPQWLAAIDVDGLGEKDRLAVKALLVKAWRIGTGADPPKAPVRSAALDALKPICTAVGLDSAALGKAARASMEGVIVGSAEQSLDAMLQVIDAFLSRELLSKQTAATALLSDLQTALAGPDAPEPDVVAERAVLIVSDFSDQGQPETLHAVFDGASACPWLPLPARHNVMLITAASLADSGEETASPLDFAQIREHAELGRQAVPGVSAWIRTFATSSEEVLRVLEVFSDDEVPKPLRSALVRFCKREGSGEALWMARRYFEEHGLEDPPSLGFLKAFAACEPAEEDVGDWLVGLFNEASNRDERAGVLGAWQGFDPRDPAVRKKLITKIYLPLGAEHKGHFKLALKNIELVADPPRGTKTKLKDTLREQASRHNLRRQTERKLERAGLDKAKLSFIDKIRPEESLD